MSQKSNNVLPDISKILSRCSLPLTHQFNYDTDHLAGTHSVLYLHSGCCSHLSMMVSYRFIFRLAQWHALVKLWLHTDDSLSYLNNITQLLGSQLRKFQDFICKVFHTMELPSETTACQWHRDSRKLGTFNSASHSISKSGACPKSFNLSTYKLHTLGDYTFTICLFGTTDSYTTQIVSDLAFTDIFQLIKHSVSRESSLIILSKDSISVQTSRSQ